MEMRKSEPTCNTNTQTHKIGGFRYMCKWARDAIEINEVEFVVHMRMAEETQNRCSLERARV